MLCPQSWTPTTNHHHHNSTTALSNNAITVMHSAKPMKWLPYSLCFSHEQENYSDKILWHLVHVVKLHAGPSPSARQHPSQGAFLRNLRAVDPAECHINLRDCPGCNTISFFLPKHLLPPELLVVRVSPPSANPTSPSHKVFSPLL